MGIILKLRTLIKSAFGYNAELPEIDVLGIAQDSRLVRKAFVFIARTGIETDGHLFANAAAAAGAIAIVGERPGLSHLAGLPYLQVHDAQVATAQLAAVLYGHPSRSLNILGVTGTDGKTTTAFLIHHLLSSTKPVGLISTALISSRDDALKEEGHFTTPESPEVQRILAKFRDDGCDHAVVESSSHGFAQKRLSEINFDIGVWTNLSPEHLDFHGTFNDYREAKLELARKAKLMILNRDDDNYEIFAQNSKNSQSYGLHPKSDWRIENVIPMRTGISFELVGPSGQGSTHLPMLGVHNVANAAAAIASAVETGMPFQEALQRLEAFGGVPGRMQILQMNPFRVIVDFAHTPPSVEKVLETFRPFTKGRLILVIGAAGQRDTTKRFPLGQVASSKADLVFFTEEDSRSEAIELILADLASGAKSIGAIAGTDFELEPDRRKAIAAAIAEARPGDTVILSGKGHERTLERATETLDWDEESEARQHL